MELYIPEYTIICDTREQSPWTFYGIDTPKTKGSPKRRLAARIKKATLQTGDYSLEGQERLIAIERKSKDDFFNCCIGDRDRFMEQLRRLNEITHPFIVVESDWQSIMRGIPEREINPNSILGSVISWQLEHCPRVQWWFAPTRTFAEIAVFRLFDRYWKGIL